MVLRSYGCILLNNKAFLNDAITLSGVDRVNVIAMAMHESKIMNPLDHTQGTFSMFNMTEGYIRSKGYDGDLNALNDPNNLALAVMLVPKAPDWIVAELIKTPDLVTDSRRVEAL